MNRRKMAMSAIFLSALVMLLGLGVANLMGQAYQKGLHEGMELNKDEPDFGASVYWYKNGEFVFAAHNVMCYLGLNDTAHLIGDNTWVNSNATTTAYRWIAIGEGTGQGASDNVLSSESFRASGTFAVIGGVNGNWTITYTWTAGTFSGETITEAGVFNDGTTGNMLNVQSFSGITLSASDSLEVEFMFQAS